MTSTSPIPAKAGVEPRAARRVFGVSLREVRLRTRLLLFRLVDGLERVGLAPRSRQGAGVILCLHNVVPRHGALGVNRGLDITAADLEAVIACMQSLGYVPVPLDAVPARLRDGSPDGRRFVAYTFDDGYADNLHTALPIFRRHAIPFTVYVTTGFMDGEIPVWRYALERLLARVDQIELPDAAGPRSRRMTTLEDRRRVFFEIQARLFRADPAETAQILEAIFRGHETPPGAVDVLTPEQVKALAADPLVTIGAHTRTHPVLAGLSRADARREIDASRERLENLLGHRVRHFAYPFGSRAACSPREEALVGECGFETAVTTASRHVRAGDRLAAMPRLMLSGEYEPVRSLRILLTDAFGGRPR